MRDAGKPMGVQIDQPWRHNLTGHWNRPLGFGRIDVAGDRRNPASRNRHVREGIEGLRWVDDPSSLEKELYFRAGVCASARIPPSTDMEPRVTARIISRLFMCGPFDGSFTEDAQWYILARTRERFFGLGHARSRPQTFRWTYQFRRPRVAYTNRRPTERGQVQGIYLDTAVRAANVNLAFLSHCRCLTGFFRPQISAVIRVVPVQASVYVPVELASVSRGARFTETSRRDADSRVR